MTFRELFPALRMPVQEERDWKIGIGVFNDVHQKLAVGGDVVLLPKSKIVDSSHHDPRWNSTASSRRTSESRD